MKERGKVSGSTIPRDSVLFPERNAPMSLCITALSRVMAFGPWRKTRRWSFEVVQGQKRTPGAKRHQAINANHLRLGTPAVFRPRSSAIIDPKEVSRGPQPIGWKTSQGNRPEAIRAMRR